MVYQGFQRSSRQNLSLKILVRIILPCLIKEIRTYSIKSIYVPMCLDFIVSSMLNVKKAWFTHVSHGMGKAADVNPTLPENMMLAYDGLEIEI